jgi:hypothetical protein
MKKFIVNLLSNRFGIVLATINLCYFATFFTKLIETHRVPAGKLFLILNLPSSICSHISYKIT